MQGNDLEMLWRLTPSEERLLKVIRGIRHEGGTETAPNLTPEIVSDMALKAANESE